MHTTTTTNSFTASPFTTSYFFNDQQRQQFPSANNAINRNTINRNQHNTMTNSSSLASSLSNDFTFANIYQPSSPFIQSNYHHFSTYPPSASYGYNHNNVNKVYTTEKYPSSFLPPETSSSGSSSILSTSPSSISSSSSNSAETQFSPSIKSGNGNNCSGSKRLSMLFMETDQLTTLDEEENQDIDDDDYNTTTTSNNNNYNNNNNNNNKTTDYFNFLQQQQQQANNNNARVLKTKGSRASLRSNRSSLYLDPIMEEGANNFF